MKQLFITMLLWQLAMVTFAQGLNFTQDANWKSVLAQAKQENKYVFVDVYATWCGPCKLMDAQTFSNEQVGKEMNDKFISIKVQTDRTAKDNDAIKAWYSDAAMINSLYQIAALPTQLYFSPEGELIFRNAGYQGPGALLKTVSFVTDPALKDMGGKIRAYQNGQKDYSNMVAMIKFAFQTLGNRQLAKEMAADYNRHYLNTLTDTAKVLNHDNLEIAYRLSDTIRSSDNIIKMLIAKTVAEVDRMADNWTGVAVGITQNIAEKEELEDRLWKDKKPLIANPDWESLQRSIHQKYPQIDADRLVSDYRLRFYARTGNLAMKNKYYGMEVDRLARKGDWFQINMICWHQYFLKETDPAALRLALKWMDRALAIAYKAKPDYIALQELDTKAALLYKLGHRKQAIASEEKGVFAKQAENVKNGKDKNDSVMSTLSGNLNALEQMKSGEKIYVNEGVVYPANWKLLD